MYESNLRNVNFDDYPFDENERFINRLLIYYMNDYII